MECAFPLAFARKGRFAPYMLAATGAFHLVNARVMGLGRFVWAFTSTYPAVLYTTGPRDRTGTAAPARDDLMPRLAGALGLAIFAAGQVARVRRRRVVERGRGDERTMTTTSGNVLSYRVTGPASAAESREPIVVLENAMMATAEHWEWIATALGRRFTTVTYHRAGYGPSRYRADDRGGKGFRIASMVDDAVDLVRHVAGDRPVVLVGHSLGGYLAVVAAERLGPQVRGIGLIDSSHPAELQQSLRQAEGARALTSSLAMMPPSLHAGYGALMPRPKYIDRVPAHIRTLIQAQYRDAGLWSAAKREWAAVKDEFESFDGRLPHISAPVVVVTAGQTASTDQVQADLHDEFAAAAPRAEQHLIGGADHDEILTDAARAEEVAKILTAFIDDVSQEQR
jgi:pimeloyl-ACP methyl ester carboxylesterase